MQELVGQTLLGRYQLIRFIGRGGMAMVYEAWDAHRAVSVAVKMMHEDLAEDTVFLRRFAREADALGRLDHPNIVRFLDFVETPGHAFMVMEYIHGAPLRRQLRLMERPLTVAETVGVLEPVCSALHYAHQLGVYHCDIKPANIFIEQSGRVVLGDFGIARLSESATVTFSTPGTPAYMSPEQCQGGLRLDGRTDIYSLAITTYELLTRDRPFKGDTAPVEGSLTERVRWEQINAQPPSPRRVNPALPEATEAVVLRAMAKDPGQRPQEALAYAREFTAAAASAPIGLEPIEAAYTDVAGYTTGSGYVSRSGAGSASRSGIGYAASAPPPTDGSPSDIPVAGVNRQRAGLRFMVMGFGVVAIIILVASALLSTTTQGPTPERSGIVEPMVEETSAFVSDEETAADAAVEPTGTAAAVLPPTSPTAIEEDVSLDATDEVSTEPAPTLTPMPPTPVDSDIYVLYILSAAQSMMEDDGRKRNMALEGLFEHLANLDFPVNAGLLAYGHKVTAVAVEESCSTGNVERLVVMAPNQSQTILDEAARLEPIGRAPLEAALKAAYQEFLFKKERTNLAILIGDGVVSCSGDNPFEAIAFNEQFQQSMPIYVIGLDVELEDSVMLEDIADETNATFYPASSSSDVARALDDVLGAFKP